jgi:large subunit ribosomal protein L1
VNKIGKKHQTALDVLNKKAKPAFGFQEGLSLVKQLAHARFDESVTINVTLGINPEKSDQSVRGSVVLPNTIGKEIRIIAFAKGDQEQAALKAGAMMVGAEDLVEKILGGWLDFDYAVATPDLMALVGKAAKVLGPKGLLPNKKNNTVALDLTSIIKELKSGLLFFKNNKSGQVNFRFGKVSFSVDQLTQNLETFFKSLRQSKPPTSKGAFIRKATISSTMGPGILLTIDSIFA